jgi:hypothetical protein
MDDGSSAACRRWGDVFDSYIACEQRLFQLVAIKIQLLCSQFHPLHMVALKFEADLHAPQPQAYYLLGKTIKRC